MTGPRATRKTWPTGSGSPMEMRCYRLLVAVLLQCCALLLFSAGPAQASPAGPNPSSPTHIAAELVVEGEAAPGGTVMLAILMKPAPGWHGYWRNPGDAGLGMTLAWSAPYGTRPGEPLYPVPDTLLISGLMNHVYKGFYAVLVPFSAPRDAKAGTRLPVAVDAQWLACTDEICVPERARLETVVTVGTDGRRDARFDAWRARLPAPLGAQSQFVRDGDTIRVGVPLPAAMLLESPHFFAAQDRVADYAAPQGFARQGDLLIVTLKRARTAPLAPAQIEGVLRLNRAGDGLAIAATPGTVPAGGTPLAEAASDGGPAAQNLALLLLGALVGGLLLNVMPCVFPILSLKALSLARAGESEAQARAEGLAYAAGVVTACVALGVLLLVLRAAGEEVGWAFQLQEPGVVAALLLLAVAITANLLGVFEFSVPGFADSGSPQGAFATGLLAAFVATPCTGPFMAGAMGAALLLPPLPAVALFATLGIGIALPFLAIAFVPALRRRMPRPGAWMVRFRRWMALPMALTALALLWLASRLGGGGFALACALLAALLLTFLAMSGRGQRQGRPVALLTMAGLAVTAGLSALVLPRVMTAPDAAGQGLLPARPFSAAALASARDEGKPVFAYFTADWCLTCKVNESVAIERADVAAAFAKAGVVVLRGDWTRRDPAITRFLTEHGAAGVPLYVWYPARGAPPRVLPQVLTPGLLIALPAN